MLLPSSTVALCLLFAFQLSSLIRNLLAYSQIFKTFSLREIKEILTVRNLIFFAFSVLSCGLIPPLILVQRGCTKNRLTARLLRTFHDKNNLLRIIFGLNYPSNSSTGAAEDIQVLAQYSHQQMQRQKILFDFFSAQASHKNRKGILIESIHASISTWSTSFHENSVYELIRATIDPMFGTHYLPMDGMEIKHVKWRINTWTDYIFVNMPFLAFLDVRRSHFRSEMNQRVTHVIQESKGSPFAEELAKVLPNPDSVQFEESLRAIYFGVWYAIFLSSLTNIPWLLQQLSTNPAQQEQILLSGDATGFVKEALAHMLPVRILPRQINGIPFVFDMKLDCTCCTPKGVDMAFGYGPRACPASKMIIESYSLIVLEIVKKYYITAHVSKDADKSLHTLVVTRPKHSAKLFFKPRVALPF
ncbi:hypothetical protein BCR33DRAFT_763346 [Rhizoclosmatium globosum]|uniref:Cytochrome P450 n=1 Tax=Rhizoclosmatium globosum TaxID=329046 RepID=A0A1Y2CRN6_9FUNG|nr:hypothetical protein BCR33DRAFT_763346 [Rhizoclosmatium globosum]|eukprot:ORY49627.1 hypothetical protein BCR33DRAFT_763346 [Rhizoclosmatium globosum]